MKKILLLTTACICTSWLSAQFIYKIKADSVLITNDTCNAELILENSTKHVLGFLYNKGNGRTEFRTGSSIGDFILNQNSSDQSASFRINGSGQFGSYLRLGNLSSNPSGSNGMLYYNTTLNKFRGFKSSDWVDFLTSGDIVGSNGMSLHYDNVYTNKWQFNFGEACFGCGGANPGGSKLVINTYVPMNGYSISFTKGDNTTSDGYASTYTHITPNRGITLGNYQNIPEGSLLRIGSFSTTGSKAGWYNPETANTTPNELAHIYTHPGAFAGTNGTEGRGLLIELDMGTTIGNYYGSKTPIGADIYLRSNSNYNSTYNGDWIGLRLKSVTWNDAITPRTKMYSLWADSGRVYFSDSVMIGTTSPRAKLTHDGTVSLNLGSDATGDIFYRNSSGLLTKLNIGANNYVLTSNGTIPSWQPASGGGGGSPGGSNGQVQFNNSGSFGGSSDFNWDNTNSRLGIATSSPQYKLDVNGDGRISTLPYLADRDTVLTYDPASKQIKATLPTVPGTLIGIRVLTSGTSYTPTTGTKSILVHLIGGGGGGGGVTGSNNNIGAGAGGGSGSLLTKYLTGIGAGPYTYAIGAAGTAGANTGGTGGAGGSTTLTIGATTYTAPGGSGGVGQTAGTAAAIILAGNGGSVSTNGDVNGSGQPGQNGFRLSGTAGSSGSGGSSLYGGGGNSRNTAGTGNAGTGYGAGGGGALSTANTNQTGGAGTAGIIIIYEYK